MINEQSDAINNLLIDVIANADQLIKESEFEQVSRKGSLTSHPEQAIPGNKEPPECDGGDVMYGTPDPALANMQPDLGKIGEVFVQMSSDDVKLLFALLVKKKILRIINDGVKNVGHQIVERQSGQTGGGIYA